MRLEYDILIDKNGAYLVKSFSSTYIVLVFDIRWILNTLKARFEQSDIFDDATQLILVQTSIFSLLSLGFLGSNVFAIY